jgi:hypothetical protein
MFEKKCPECSKKIERKFDFCPYCGIPLKDEGDYGLLGKSDDADLRGNSFNNAGSGIGIGGSFFDKIIGGAVRMIEKEMQKSATEAIKAERSMKSPRGLLGNSNFELFINGKRVNLPGDIAGLQIEEPNQKISEERKVKIPKLSEETIKKSVKLPRIEAKTKLIRTSEKITYELETPGLISLSNVLINKLEDALEIKAYTENAVYIKTLQIKLPLTRYVLKQDKLVLEFNPQ